MSIQNLSKTKRRLSAAALAAGVAGLAFSTGVVTTTGPSYAEAVQVAPAAESFGFANVVEKVSPAVVSVRVKEAVRPAADDGDGASPFDSLPEGHPLRRFFEGPNGQQLPGQRGPQRRAPREGGMAQGSGFFISDDGYVVTNNHVVDGGTQYTVVMDDGTEYDAKLIGTDPRTDLALLKVDAQNQKFTYVNFADDSKVRVGDWVIAVGNPFGLGGSVTAGIVSARGRDIGAGPYDDFIQIDAPVNRGNSGGPAFNQQGQVIGINTAIFSPSGGSVGIGFAIPASTAQSVVQSLRENGNVQRGWLGVQIAPVTKDIAEAVGLGNEKGAIVTLPDTETPATKAGIQTGDVITAVNGETVDGPRDLARKVAAYRPGTTVDVTLWRGGSAQDVKVALGNIASLDEASNQGNNNSRVPVNPSSLQGYGLTLTPSDEGNGVVVTDVDPDSEAATRGVSAGDTIVAVNGKAVNSQREVQDAIKAAKDSGRKAALFQLRQNDQNRFVALPIAGS
ncbi:Do family serine endopeptidase [Aureimonas jatrophae]|uniref:Probable periplasmic serine endoprotease DegP-like n=1 Tax=Aureimonas jatrophae TaxID=1166073 RepID=A0A1H0CR64_9HYPH|nr:Do family serine endopeptidase [Aureimonas jatrophae]MBB3949350.1 serine protease Do [Aureimonas jatrophae]SDN60384.1 serine protease Do [Aureimonas jatrophae]